MHRVRCPHIVFLIAALFQVVASAWVEAEEPDADFFFRAGGGYRDCVSYFSRYWEPYPCVRFTLDLPTAMPRFFFRTAFDAGQIRQRNAPHTRLLALHTAFCCLTDLRQRAPLRLRAGGGVSSATYSFTSSLELDTKPFSTSESEFGATIIVEPAWRKGRFEVTVPLSFDYILSLPHPLLSISAALMAGGVF